MPWRCSFNNILSLSLATLRTATAELSNSRKRLSFIFCKIPKMRVLPTCLNRGNDGTASTFPAPLYPFFPLFSVFNINNKWIKPGINCTSGSALARAVTMQVATAAKSFNFKLEILILKLSVRDWLIFAAKLNRPVPSVRHCCNSSSFQTHSK